MVTLISPWGTVCRTISRVRCWHVTGWIGLVVGVESCLVRESVGQISGGTGGGVFFKSLVADCSKEKPPPAKEGAGPRTASGGVEAR